MAATLSIIIAFVVVIFIIKSMGKPTNKYAAVQEDLDKFFDKYESAEEVQICFPEEENEELSIRLTDGEENVPVSQMSIRPTMKMRDFSGQDKAKTVINLSLAKTRRDTDFIFPHTLFTGSGGTGKSTMAQCIANELGSKMFFTTPHMLNSPPKIFEFFFDSDFNCKLEFGDIVFIDEIHSFTERNGAFLYSVLQDFSFDWKDKQGNLVRLSVTPFTCIGATTDVGLLHPPLVARFVNQVEFEDYSHKQLMEIAQRAFPNLLDGGASIVAARSTGVPRIVKRIAFVSSLVAESKSASSIDKEHVEEACLCMGIDSLGLDSNAHKVIEFFLNRENKPAGTQAVSAATRVSRNNLDGQTFRAMSYAGVLELTRLGKKLTDKYYLQKLKERETSKNGSQSSKKSKKKP